MITDFKPKNFKKKFYRNIPANYFTLPHADNSLMLQFILSFKANICF